MAFPTVIRKALACSVNLAYHFSWQGLILTAVLNYRLAPSYSLCKRPRVMSGVLLNALH